MNVDPKTLIKHINTFAQVVDLVELNRNIPRRYYRSFKLTVESFSKDAVLDSKNWPGGIQIKRWWPQKKAVENTKINKPVTHLQALLDHGKKSNITTEITGTTTTENPKNSETLESTNSDKPTEVFQFREINAQIINEAFGHSIPNTFQLDNTKKAEELKKKQR